MKRFYKEEAAAARKEEMEEKKEQKIDEDIIENNREVKRNTETEEATNMGADTEEIGGSGLHNNYKSSFILVYLYGTNISRPFPSSIPFLFIASSIDSMINVPW